MRKLSRFSLHLPSYSAVFHSPCLPIIPSASSISHRVRPITSTWAHYQSSHDLSSSVPLPRCQIAVRLCMRDSPVFLGLISRYRACLSPTSLPRCVPVSRSLRLSPTIRLPAPSRYYVWPRSSTHALARPVSPAFPKQPRDTLFLIIGLVALLPSYLLTCQSN